MMPSWLSAEPPRNNLKSKGDNELKTCRACQTQVQEGMYAWQNMFFRLMGRRTYDIERNQTRCSDHDGTVSVNLQRHRM